MPVNRDPDRHIRHGSRDSTMSDAGAVG